MVPQLFDPATPFGERVARRLREEMVIWYTSVDREGTPQPNPVWFIWQNGAFLVYNRARAGRVAHARRGGRVALHFDGNGRGGDIVVFTGAAELALDTPPPNENSVYRAKYEAAMKRVSGDVERFAREYPTAIRIRPDRLRGR